MRAAFPRVVRYLKKLNEYGLSYHTSVKGLNQIRELNMFQNERLRLDLEEKIPQEIKGIVLSCLHGEDIEIVKQELMKAKSICKYNLMSKDD